MDKPYAIIYPVPEDLTHGLFEDEYVVFVKYTPHEVISENLRLCEKLLFYESKGEKMLIGEGKIDNIELLNLNKILEKYENDLFISRETLFSYSNGRTKKPIVFTLKEPYKYNNKVKLKKPITMGGKLINKEEYDNIVN